MMWAGLILALLGTAMKNKQMKKAAERQRNEFRIGREKEKEVESTQRSEVLDEAGAYDPAQRQEALDTNATKAEDAINAVLADNESITSGDVGVISDKLLSQRAKSTRDKANNASILAALMSKVQAPGDTAVDESRGMLDLIADSQGRSGDLRRIARTTGGLAELEGMPNSMSMMLGGLAQQGGMSLASNNIMSALQPPGGGGVATGTAGPGVRNMTPNPNYRPVSNQFISGV